MTWFKISDGLAFHRKAVAAGNEAIGAWVRAGAWCSAPDNLTDGYIPPEIARAIAPPKVWGKLRAAGLTEAPSDGRPGEQIHDFLTYNPRSDETRGHRGDLSSKRSEAGRRGAARRWQKDSKSDGKHEANAMATAWQTPRQNDGPVPSRPVPISDPDPSSTRAGGDGKTDPEPDLLTLAQSLAAEGSTFGRSVVDRAAQGRLPTPAQRAALRKIRDERAGAATTPPPDPSKPSGPREPTRAELAAMVSEGDRFGMSPATEAIPPPPRRKALAVHVELVGGESPGPPEPNGAPPQRVDLAAMFRGGR